MRLVLAVSQFASACDAQAASHKSFHAWSSCTNTRAIQEDRSLVHKSTIPHKTRTRASCAATRVFLRSQERPAYSVRARLRRAFVRLQRTLSLFLRRKVEKCEIFNNERIRRTRNIGRRRMSNWQLVNVRAPPEGAAMQQPESERSTIVDED